MSRQTQSPHGLKARLRLWNLVFRNPHAALTLLLVAVHQAIIASSVFFLAQVVHSFERGAPSATWLLLYMGAMTLPFLPGCLSFVTMQWWENHVHQKITAALAESAHGKISFFRCPTTRDTFESAISRNAFGAVGGYIGLTHDFFSLLLNSVFSMAVIGFLLPQELLLGYAISFVLALVFIRLFNVPAQDQSTKLEELYSAYGGCLARAWDNAVTGNTHNYDAWRQDRINTGKSYYRQLIRLAALKQAGNVTIALASLLPTAYLVYSLAVSESTAPSVLAVIIVNLTRIFHILNSLGTLIYQMLEWATTKARLAYLLKVQDTLAYPPELPEAPAGKITLNGKPVADFKSAIGEVQNAGVGRYTIRGANGSGKSTLLLAMKNAYRESAYFLPTAAAGLNWRGRYHRCSTGQRMRGVLQEISNSTAQTRYLLLDEWDANLDDANKKELDGLLASLSQAFVVVEVRH